MLKARFLNLFLFQAIEGKVYSREVKDGVVGEPGSGSGSLTCTGGTVCAKLNSGRYPIHMHRFEFQSQNN